MDDNTRTELEAAAFRRLVEHLRERTDVQNIDLMNLAGFCRNCLSRWYREAAEERSIPLSDPQAREIVYGMPYDEWRKKHQKEASPEQKGRLRRFPAAALTATDAGSPYLAPARTDRYRRRAARGCGAIGERGTMPDVGGIAGERLKSFIERIERLEEEKRTLAEDIKEVYAEAKGTGFDTKIIRQIIRIRKRDQDELDEEETLLDLYKRAIGMLPDAAPQAEAAE